MNDSPEQFELPEGKYTLTLNQNEHYRLISGSVLVYVLPMQANSAGEPKLYCRITDKDHSKVIPALSCCDHTGTSWYLLIRPENGNAILEFYGSKQTSVLFRNFLKRGNLFGYDAESFETSMIAYYNNSFVLSHSDPDPYLCVNSDDAYRIVSGTTDIFIVPLENGLPGKPQHCCTIAASDSDPYIPSFVFQDNTKTLWFLMIRAAEATTIVSRISNGGSDDLKKRFLSRIENMCSDPACFEKSLIDYYEEKSKFHIGATDYYLTTCNSDIYFLEKGSVFVYITPLLKGRPDKPLFFCEISDADPNPIIPGLAFDSFNRTHWRLMIKSNRKEDVLIKPLRNQASASVHQEFLKRGDIVTYDLEGFERSLVEHYTKKVILPNSGFIAKSDKANRASRKDVQDLFKDVFSGEGQAEHTNMPVFQALQFVCKKTNISLMKADKLAIMCGENAGIHKVCQASNIICRNVILDADWYKNDCGGFIGTMDQEVIACAPDKKGKYLLFRTSDESITPVTADLAKQISPKAYALGRTLPSIPLSRKDVFSFCKKSIHSRDLRPYILLTILCSAIGVLIPMLNRMIYDDYIPVGDIGNLSQLCLVMLTFMIGNISFSIVKNLFGYRITSRVGFDLQNAVYHRLFHLPESYFSKYDSADLAGRVAEIGPVASRYANALVLSNISTFFSIFYLIRMFQYNNKLSILGICIYLIYLLLITAITAASRRSQFRIAEAESEANGKLYQYLNGVDKIRMAGTEERALLSFMQPYSKQQLEEIKTNKLVSIEEALTSVIHYVFAMVLYWYIVKKLHTSDITVGTFAAFNSAFGAFTAALGTMVDEGLLLLQEKHTFKRFWSVFETAPEDNEKKEMPGTISGAISMEHVHFSYDPSHKVLDDVSIHIKPGEYVGIVGPSGCGKSTLLKLLLGFETPQSGSVMIGRKDLSSLNKAAYRQQLGVVLQNGKLISGSIFENITITAPDADAKRVNEVIAKVGLKEDILQMPMGIHTILGDNSNTISGGQQQRILIARAICGNPKILIFDEATSALDNVSQATVINSLDQMQITRIVVAHRLSTIQNCDRIYVMEDGKIVQQGNYDTLMKDQNGLFYQLASRQIAQ